MKKKQSKPRNSLLIFLAGLFVGLAIALAVALYISKLPTNFLLPSNKSNVHNQPTQPVDSQWNPNAHLSNLSDDDIDASSNAASGPIEQDNFITQTNQAGADHSTDPIADIVKNIQPSSDIAANRSVPSTVQPHSNNDADPLAAIIKQRSQTTAGAKNYLLQTGAFKKRYQAEQQITTLKNVGIKLQVIESLVDGDIIYRVRTNPMDYDSALQAKAAFNARQVNPNILKTN